MRILLAVEGHRDYSTYFVDFTEEILEEHPDLTMKLGEVIGLYYKYK